MRLAVLSDVHGNLPALKAVLQDARQHDVAGVIVAGDLVHGGPYPVETAHLLQSLNAWMIRGNGDDYLLDYDAGTAPEAWYTSRAWALTRWSYRQMDRETLNFIASLPGQRVIHLPGTSPIRVVHGSPRSSTEHLIPDQDPQIDDVVQRFRRAGMLPANREPVRLASILGQITESALVCGHSHVPWKQEWNGKLVFNPGAVSGPLNGEVCAQYAFLNWQAGQWEVEHRQVAYDLAEVHRAFVETGLLAEGEGLARAFLLSIETGQNVGLAFQWHVRQLAAEAGCGDAPVVPDPIWERATASFDWENASV